MTVTPGSDRPAPDGGPQHPTGYPYPEPSQRDLPPAGLDGLMSGPGAWFRRPWVWALVIAVVGLFITGAVYAVGAVIPTTFDLHGQIALKRLLAGSDGNGGCRGLRAYGDLGPGRQVTVYDGNGALVATGALGQGMYSDKACIFPIEVPGVPDGRGSYTVSVGEDRGRLTYSRDQAANGGVSMTLGN